MSMVNNAHPGSSLSLLHLIDRVLLRKGKSVARTEILELLRPEFLPKSDNAEWRFEKNLDFWIKEGLWSEDESGVLTIPVDATEKNLPERVLALIVVNTKQATDQSILDDKRVEPFFRAMTCLLAQQAYTFMGGEVVEPGKNGNAQEAVNKWLPGDRGLNLSNELTIFLQYGEFLGFLEPFKEGYILDPTRAIEPYLDLVFGGEEKLSLKTFLGKLSEKIPLLDGGRFRNLLEPLMQELGWHPHGANQISPALSHALVRLENAFRLRFDKASDDGNSMQLQLPNGVIRHVGEVFYIPEVTV
ncbi:protein DpdG [Pseudomonas taeanensis]|uniref:protein DpdG n=1 Tax=Pseudomonas taeanensis TaxID=574962 RepID=UPI00128FA88C|nr:protein DpdG [Pseudomonas taeanensis]